MDSGDYVLALVVTTELTDWLLELLTSNVKNKTAAANNAHANQTVQLPLSIFDHLRRQRRRLQLIRAVGRPTG